MIARLLDRLFVLFVKTLAYIAGGLTVSIWLLVIIALFVNLFKLLR
jgi:ABC-type Na+ efflux pump permease subunit